MKIRSLLAALTIVAVLALALVAPPPALAYDADQVTLSTNAITGATTNNTTFTSGAIFVGKQSQVALQVSAALDGAGTTTVGFKVEQSVDGSNFADSAHELALTPNGTNTVYSLTNYSVGGYGWLRLAGGTNANASSVTNIVLKYGDKREF